jgi:hypothetical protein
MSLSCATRDIATPKQIQVALHEAAELRRRRSSLRLEAETAAADPDGLAEALRVREEMDAISDASSDAG